LLLRLSSQPKTNFSGIILNVALPPVPGDHGTRGSALSDVSVRAFSPNSAIMNSVKMMSRYLVQPIKDRAMLGIWLACANTEEPACINI